MSDFQDQWLIWKLIAKTTRLSNNITVLCKENIEEIAVEKSIFLADILVRVILFPTQYHDEATAGVCAGTLL